MRVPEIEAVVDPRQHDLGHAGRGLPGDGRADVDPREHAGVLDQIGGEVPLIVEQDRDVAQQRRLLFNPRVLAVADLHEKGEEGSVSLPGVRVEIARPVWVDLAFMDAAGTTAQRRFEGFAARVALHEIEQMQGIFFLDRVSRLKRDMALKKARKATG